MSLHLVFNTAGLKSCLARRLTDEPVVLLGDGVYEITDSTVNCYALREDAETRGVADTSQAKLIDYADLVTLTIDHPPSISWAD